MPTKIYDSCRALLKGMATTKNESTNKKITVTEALIAAQTTQLHEVIKQGDEPALLTRIIDQVA